MGKHNKDAADNEHTTEQTPGQGELDVNATVRGMVAAADQTMPDPADNSDGAAAGDADTAARREAAADTDAARRQADADTAADKNSTLRKNA